MPQLGVFTVAPPFNRKESLLGWALPYAFKTSAMPSARGQKPRPAAPPMIALLIFRLEPSAHECSP